MHKYMNRESTVTKVCNVCMYVHIHIHITGLSFWKIFEESVLFLCCATVIVAICFVVSSLLSRVLQDESSIIRFLEKDQVSFPSWYL
jgi:hypothetical protein